MEQRIKVCLIEDDKFLCNKIEEHINRSNVFELTGTAMEGSGGEELLSRLDFDAAVINAILPYKDGVSLLRDYMTKKQNSERQGKVFIMLAAVSMEILAGSVQNSGADRFFVKPVDIGEMFYVIAELYRAKLASKAQPVDKYAEELLNRLGINKNLKGYNYLKSAIKKSVENIGVLDGITKILYPGIAKENASTSIRVERDIRHAIGESWKNGNRRVFAEALGYKEFQERKPTNRDFIRAASEVWLKT